MDLREMPSNVKGRHPCEESRARFFRAQLAPHLRPCAQVLDFGAGDGYLAAGLLPAVQSGGSVVCLDVGYSDDHLDRFAAKAPAGLSFTRQRPESSFDIVLLLDVLEHVPDDLGFLTGVVRELLRPQGILLASVPAHPWLFTEHDAVLGHRRRYRTADFHGLLNAAGLRVEVATGLFHSLLPIRAGQKLQELIRGVHSHPVVDSPPAHADTALSDWDHGRWVSAAFRAVLGLDNRISAVCGRARLSLPGLSIWALARRS